MGTTVTERPNSFPRRVLALLSALFGIHSPRREFPRYEVSDTLKDIERTINEVRRTANPTPVSDA